MADVFHRRRVLSRLRAPSSSSDRARAGMPSAPPAVVRAAVACTAVTVFAQVGPGAAVLVVLTSVVAPRATRTWRAEQAQSRSAAELAAALEEVARRLRTGVSLRTAVAEAAAAATGPVADELGALAGRAEAGESLDAALAWWAAGTEVPGAPLAAAALGLASEAGGTQAQAIDAVAATLRQRLAASAQVGALATQARASAAVIGIAPLAFCVLASASDHRTAAFLLQSLPGAVVLVAGIGLDLVGAAWMHRITAAVKP